MKIRNARLLATAACLLIPAPTLRADWVEYLTGIQWRQPPVVTPAATDREPPSDAVVLFDGEDASAWEGADKWKIEDGALVVGQGRIFTRQHFGDCQLHIEWSAPTEVVGEGQGRGNSGVFFMAFPDANGYEIQVLDCFQNQTYPDGQAAAIYKQTPPLANAMRPPGEWNTYDILWTAPRFNGDGSLASPAYLTALHNGVVVQNHYELQGDTPYNRPPRYQFDGKYGPIALQDHGNPVCFRNIWIREMKPPVGEQVRGPYYRDGDEEIPAEEFSN